jgi:hypothetical protein
MLLSEIAPFHLDHIPLAAAGCQDDALVENGRNLGQVSLLLPPGIVSLWMPGHVQAIHSKVIIIVDGET